MKYGLLLVSHTAEIPNGIQRLLQQVAADVPLTIAGGTEENEVGTSLERIQAGITENTAEEILAFYDLGSARMNLEMAQEFADKPVHIFNAAFVEGAYTAAALLQAGADWEAIQAQLAALTLKK